MSPPVETETKEADSGQLQDSQCQSQGMFIAEDNQDLHSNLNRALNTQGFLRTKVWLLSVHLSAAYFVSIVYYGRNVANEIFSGVC